MQNKLRSEKDRKLLTPDAVPADLQAAYAMAFKDLSWKPAAWKLGSSTKASQKALGFQMPIFGPLASWEMAFAPLELELPAAIPVCGEAELLLRLASTDYKKLAKKELCDAWAWSMELPSSSIINLADLPAPALVADRCAAFFLVIGRQFSMNEPWNTDTIEVKIDGQLEASGSLSELVCDPLDCILKFLQECKHYNVPVQSGQWIATGGLTKCVPLDSGLVEISWGGKPVCQFSVQQES